MAGVCPRTVLRAALCLPFHQAFLPAKFSLRGIEKYEKDGYYCDSRFCRSGSDRMLGYVEHKFECPQFKYDEFERDYKFEHDDKFEHVLDEQ